MDVTRFSTPRMTPSEVAMPMAVEPSLMASREYSTWKRRPSGEKVLMPRSGRLEQGRLAIFLGCWRGGGELAVFRSCHKHLGGLKGEFVF